MKLASQRNPAFTRLELLVVLAAVTLLAAIAFPSLAANKPRGQRVSCLNNLRMIGFGWTMWAGDHDDRTPWITQINAGGTYGNPNGYVHFLVASNELVTPKILVCPSDTQTTRVARDWREFNTSPFRGNALSYAVGTDANFVEFWRILALDRHYDGASTGTCAPAGGIPVLALLATNPNLRWNTTNIHAGTGNILFGDGSVHQKSRSLLQFVSPDSNDTPRNHHALPPK